MYFYSIFTRLNFLVFLWWCRCIPPPLPTSMMPTIKVHLFVCKMAQQLIPCCNRVIQVRKYHNHNRPIKYPLNKHPLYPPLSYPYPPFHCMNATPYSFPTPSSVLCFLLPPSSHHFSLLPPPNPNPNHYLQASNCSCCLRNGRSVKYLVLSLPTPLLALVRTSDRGYKLPYLLYRLPYINRPTNYHVTYPFTTVFAASGAVVNHNDWNYYSVSKLANPFCSLVQIGTNIRSLDAGNVHLRFFFKTIFDSRP